MPIYNQATNLSGGRFAPSVNYSANVRMPTQPMPDLPDVNTSFNIDLRPIGEAIIAGKEMEWKSQEAELDRQARRVEAAEAFQRQFMLQKMEIDSLEKRAKDANDINWYNAKTNRMKVEKEDEKDDRSAALRVATNWLNNKAMERDADIKAGPMTSADIALADKETYDEFQQLFGSLGLNITEVLPETRKLYSGFMSGIGVTEKASTESLQEAIKSKETEENAVISNMSKHNGDSFEANKQRYAQANIAYRDLEHINADLQDPSLTTVDREALENKKKDLVNSLGGERAATILTSHLYNPTHETIQRIKDEYMQLAASQGYSPSDAETMFTIADQREGWTRSAETLSNVNEKILKDNETAIKHLITNKKTTLLNNIKGLQSYTALYSISPDLAKAFLDETGFEETFMMLGTEYSTQIKDLGNGYYSVKSDGKEIEVSPNTVKAVKDRTGLDFESGWKMLQSRTLMDIINKGEADNMNGVLQYMTPKNDSEEEALVTTTNAVNVSQSINPRQLVEYQRRNPEDRGANAAMAVNKILDHFNRTKKIDDTRDNSTMLYSELTGRIHQLRPSKFISNSIKGGVIEIRTDAQGNVDLWRDAKGLAGGFGTYEGFKNIREIEKTLNSIPGLTAEEKVAFLETELGVGYFYTYPKGQMPTLKEYIKRGDEVLKVIGVTGLIEAGAMADTYIAKGISAVNKYTNIDSIADLKDTVVDLLSNKSKEPARTSSANAELIQKIDEELEEINKPVTVDIKMQTPDGRNLEEILR